ncbi:hypothetical protein ACOMHN_051822 [Nucella lapillus]
MPPPITLTDLTVNSTSDVTDTEIAAAAPLLAPGVDPPPSPSRPPTTLLRHPHHRCRSLPLPHWPSPFLLLLFLLLPPPLLLLLRLLPRQGRRRRVVELRLWLLCRPDSFAFSSPCSYW